MFFLLVQANLPAGVLHFTTLDAFSIFEFASEAMLRASLMFYVSDEQEAWVRGNICQGFLGFLA